MTLPDLLQGVPLPDLDQAAVQAACSQVRDYCDWHIAPVITETVSVMLPARPAGMIVLLPSLRVVSVTSVTAGGVDTPFTWASGRLTLTGAPQGEVLVTFTHGYDSCPESVRAAVAKIASRGFVPTARVKSQNAGPFVNAFFEEADDLAAVYRYRRLVVA